MLPRTLRLLCLLLFWSGAPLIAQSVIERLITPGPLSKPHATLEANCGSCHESFSKSAQNAKCLACHKPVALDISRSTGFHGRFKQAHTASCKSCHSEHKGRSFAIAQFSRSSFNHNFTDYPLTGGHARATCAGCHRAGSRFRDTATNCADCHGKADPHKGQLGRACQSCHLVDGWKQLLPFDHQKTGFALVGAHATTKCLTCHVAQRWKGLATTCNACHAKDDVHKGSRGPACSSCHSSTSWKSARFDHDSTGFPLLGGHATTDCASCHGQNNAIKRPARTCSACHAKDDVHKGQNGGTCESCHTSRSWKQVSFDHDKLTRFPLRGAHRATTCQACHSKPPKVVKLSVDCVSCHAVDDVHKGGNGADCAHCHGEKSWKIVSFDHNVMTRFPLHGAHAEAKCQACHTKPPREQKLASDCASCHQKDDVHKGRLGSVCSTCHGDVSWKTDIRFDHALTSFPLLGKHAAATCAACHVDKGFSAKGESCAACHVDDHHKGTLGKPASCGACHDSVDWKTWSFDHDRATSFPLTGSHKGLVCSGCHARPGDPAKVSMQCISCHRRDDVHRGGFGPDCQRCHETIRFSAVTM